VSTPLLRTAWYRFGATFGRRWGGYLTVVILVALMGGLAMGSIAGARRTQSSFSTYIASTNPSDLTVGTALYSPTVPASVGYSPSVVRAIARLPDMRRVESYAGFGRNIQLLVGGDTPEAGPFSTLSGVGSVNGEFFTQDRVTIVAGRMANPARADEIVLSAATARADGIEVGTVYPLGFYTNAQTYLPGYGTASVKPYLRVNARVVGLAVFNDEVVQDDIDVEGSQYALFTPALTRRLTQCCTTYSFASFTLAGGTRHLASTEAALGRIVPRRVSAVAGAPYLTSATEEKASRSIEPESIAFGVFGAITALAALLIAAQVIGRQLRVGADERTTLRALGAGPAMTTSDGLIGLLGAVVVGSLLAVGVAVGLSPLAPLGPVRPVDPHPGLAFDWTVLGIGLVVLVAGLSAVAVALSARQTPGLVARRRQGARPGSSLARLAATSDLPSPAVAGIRFALDPGGGATAVPVRSAILGATLAVIVVITTVTFGASLTTLVSHPRLYGWNWDYELVSAGGEALGNIPAHQAASLLDSDPQVAGWAGVYFSALTLNGQSVPVMGARPGVDVQPPVLSGHRLDAPNQVVLGATTLAELHERVGDTVVVTSGSAAARLRIVGVATMPAIGLPAVPHLEPGTGALLDSALIPATSRNVFANPIPGPNAILVRFTHGPSAASFDSIQATVVALEGSGGQGSITIDPVQRPAEIVNYRSIGDTPALLGLALGAGAVVALALTLIASVRRRRRELALFKTLGFTGRQLAATVAWQSSIAVGLGTVLGVPLGIVLGRILWVQFAHAITVVPAPSVPVVPVVGIALGALVLANLIAAIPGWIAARTPTALLLRAE
jgi:MacB-like periplasmic core domain